MMRWFYPFIFLMAFETLGNYVSGLFGVAPNLPVAVLALAIYALANYFWLIALKRGSGLARGTIYFGVLVIVMTGIIGFSFYEEALSLTKAVGLVTGTASLVLLSDAKKA
jgi:hypothetical protein